MTPITTDQLELLINQFASNTSVGLLMAAPLTLLIVALLKRIPALATIKSEWLAFVVALLFQAVAMYAGASEGAIPFATWFERINAAVPPAIGIIAALGFSSLAYRLSKHLGLPVIGYQRPDNDVAVAPPTS